MAEHGFPSLFNYTDDFIYTGLPSLMNVSFQFLKAVLSELELHISINKLVPPSTSVACLGILIDSVNETISIPQEKHCEIIQMCVKWEKYCGKRDLQSLLGSLLYVSKLEKHCRFFLIEC